MYEWEPHLKTETEKRLKELKSGVVNIPHLLREEIPSMLMPFFYMGHRDFHYP